MRNSKKSHINDGKNDNNHLYIHLFFIFNIAFLNMYPDLINFKYFE